MSIITLYVATLACIGAIIWGIMSIVKFKNLAEYWKYKHDAQIIDNKLDGHEWVTSGLVSDIELREKIKKIESKYFGIDGEKL